MTNDFSSPSSLGVLGALAVKNSMKEDTGRNARAPFFSSPMTNDQ
jgi:hypothetical protein